MNPISFIQSISRFTRLGQGSSAPTQMMRSIAIVLISREDMFFTMSHDHRHEMLVETEAGEMLVMLF